MKPLYHIDSPLSDFIATIDNVDVWRDGDSKVWFILRIGDSSHDWDFLELSHQGPNLGPDIRSRISKETLTKIVAYINLIS